MFPGNILGDFAAGSLMCAFGIVTALYERTKSGKGQIIDSAILDGTLYLGSFIYNVRKTAQTFILASKHNWLHTLHII